MINLRLIFKWVKIALKSTFNPPEDATSKQIRIYGLGAWLIGFVLAIINNLFFIYVTKNDDSLGIIIHFILLLSLVAAVLMVSGCYRTLTGKKDYKGDDNHISASFARIIIGMVAYVLAIAIPLAIFLLVIYILQWAGIEV